MVGIYCIRHDDKFYVGQSINIERRWKGHCCDLMKGKHNNKHLQSSWNKYEHNTFHFEVIEICIPENLDDREQYWMNELDSFHQGFNQRPQASSMKGTKRSDETRRKMSEMRKGKKHKPHTKRGPHSEETRRKMCESHKRRVTMSKAGKRRAPVSEETKRKLSEAWKHRTPVSDETKRKLSEAGKRRHEARRAAKIEKELL
jgi:group I intron endonuclease